MNEKRNEGIDRFDFEELVTNAYPIVFNRLVARFKDAQLAEEVSVDSLTHAFEKWQTEPNFFRTHDLAVWSSRWATWRALDRLRERTRHRPLPDEHPREGNEATPVPAVLPSFDDRNAARLRDREIAWICLQMLDPEDRALLSRYYYDGQTDQELGDKMFGKTASPQANGLKVWRRRQRACARLRELLLASGIEPADWSSAGAQAV